MAISYNDYKKKYGKQIEKLLGQKSTKLPSAVDAKSTYEMKESGYKRAQESLQNKYSDAGVITRNSGILPIADRSSVLSANTKIDFNNLNIPSASTHKSAELEKKISTNQEKYKELSSTEEVKNLTKNVEEQYDETANSYYTYLQSKVNEDDIGVYDKTVGRLIDGATSLFTPGGKYRLTNENGDTYSMPTYNDLKNQKVMESYNTGVGKVVGGALYEGGKLLTTAALNSVVPGSGSATYFGGLWYKQYNNAVSEGYDPDDAIVYATLGTSTEVITGKILGGTTNALFGTGSSEMSKGISRSLSKVIKNHPRLVNALSNAISEGSEEFVQEYLDKFNRNLTLGANEKVFTQETFEDAIYSAAVGALTGSVSGAVDSNNYLEIERQNQTRRSKDFVNNLNNSNDIVDNAVASKIQQNNGVNYSQGNNINQMLKSENTPSYTFEQNENTKINELNQSASQYFNDSYQTKNMIRTIENVVKDKGYHVLFDDTITNKNGQSVNAKIQPLENGEIEIRINPNSERAGEFLLVHEVTHAIEEQNMKDFVIKFAEKHSDFNEVVESVKKAYGVDDVTSEVLADVSGQLFGNQEFLNSLVAENSVESKNVIKVIYESIKKLLNTLTEEGRYKNFVQDLEKMWRDAYRNTTTEQAVNNLNNNTSYSLKTLKDGTTYVQTENNLFTNSDGTEMNQKEIYNSLIGKQIKFNDGIVASIRKWLPNKKNLYKELFTRYPAYQNVNDIKNVNKNINNNIVELLENSENIKKNEPDYMERHKINKINTFDTRRVSFFDGNKAYTLDFSIARLNNGEYVAYAKRNLYQNTKLLNDIKKETPMGKSQRVLPSYANNISQSNNNVKSDTSSTKYSMQESINNTQGLDNSSFNLKEEQLKIIEESNPAGNEVATWIRNINDIKTFEETLQESDYKEYYEAGEDFDETYTANMAKDALETGKIKVYSSYPIKQGVFVTPSQMEAESYAGNGRLYSKEVSLSDVAWIDPTQGQYAQVSGKYSQDNSNWQEHLEKNYKATGTRTNMNDIKLPTAKDTKSDSVKLPSRKTLNPVEISNLKPEDANTTPKLPSVKRNKSNDGDSKLWDNIKNKTNMLNDEQKNFILKEDEVKYYDKITNKDTLEEAFDKLNEDGKDAVNNWLAKKSETANVVDVAQGWILLKQYADNNDAQGMVNVAKRLREIGTKAGQTVQAFNILERMTPEGMIKYAQSELMEAYDKMAKNKSKKWIDANKAKFDLTTQEVQAIMDIMDKVSTMEDGYDKRVELAKIQKIMTDKLPPAKGAGIKSWMRISMLFNPKTQARNVLGNAIITPVNTFSDIFSGIADKAISKKTGYRTTGVTNVRSYVKGFKKGLYESYNDFRLGINTRNIEGNRFELTEGKSFNDNTKTGKRLNKFDNVLSFMLDAGDRGFYEASFTNSINNQLALNKTTEVTQEMIDIATQEALSRTWQDNNNYTRAVLSARKLLNEIHIPGKDGYGLGDVLIPFAKTPANLTKAIVDYSPAGLVNVLVQGNNLKNALETGQFTPQMQHKFVQSLGKAAAGTMVYVLGFALAKAGITSGESDDDKDAANFLKNTLGISSYSIKIGNKSFTYDWAQPIAAPLSITANIVNSPNKEMALLEGIIGSLDSAGNILLEQSFLQSISDVLSDTEGPISGIITEVLELPARAIPTFSKQIADLIDGTQRTTYEYKRPVKSAANYAVSKIPGFSKFLAPTVDTLGREVQKYGGKNNLFNVFLNPANVNTENISESAKEIYGLYKETGKTDIMPRVAPYYVNKDGEKTILTSKQKSEYQKISGKLIEESINTLMENVSYNTLTNDEKASTIADIVNYSYNIAQKEVLGFDISKTYAKAYEYSQIGDVSDYYLFKNSIDDSSAEKKKESIKEFLINSDLDDKQLAFMYSNYYSSEDTVDLLLTTNVSIKEFIKFNSKTFESDYDSEGKTKSNSRKNKVIEYINSLDLGIAQKAILVKMEYSSFGDYDQQIIDYVNKMSLSKFDKAYNLKLIGISKYDSYLIEEITKQNISLEEKEKTLKKLGFKVVNGKVYS